MFENLFGRHKKQIKLKRGTNNLKNIRTKDWRFRSGIRTGVAFWMERKFFALKRYCTSVQGNEIRTRLAFGRERFETPVLGGGGFYCKF